MRTLERKDICSYLPYDLECKYSDEDTIWTIDALATETDYEDCVLQLFHLIETDGECKPILHPVSDINKPIKVANYNEGKEFIPIVEMARIAQGSKDSSHLRLQDDTVIDFTIAYHFKQNVFWFQSLQRKKQVYILPDQDKYFDLLNQWHIDYRGLIPDGLAIDVNTIKQ